MRSVFSICLFLLSCKLYCRRSQFNGPLGVKFEKTAGTSDRVNFSMSEAFPKVRVFVGF